MAIRVTFVSTALASAALAAALGTATGLVPATAAAQGGPPPGAAEAPVGPVASKNGVKGLKAAQEAIGKQEFDKALAELAKVEALADKTPGDQYYVNTLRGSILVQQRKINEAAAAYGAALDSGQMPAGDVNNTLQLLTRLNAASNPPNWSKAAEYGGRWLTATGTADRETLEIVTIASYQSGAADKCDKALAYGEKATQAAAAAQAKPAEGALQILQRCYAAKNDAASTIQVSTELVRNYPKRDYWGALTSNLLRNASTSDARTLQVLRLILALDLVDSPQEYMEMATLAKDAGFPGEAEAILRKGIGSGTFPAADKTKAQSQLDDAVRLGGLDRKELPALETQAKAAKTGDRDVTLGEAFLSYGDTDKAIEAIRRGLGKGGLKGTDEANLLLGRALLKAGNGAEAAQAFAKVTGPDLAQLGSLWAILASQGPPTG